MNVPPTNITRDQLEHAAKVLKTIAHPVKLEILKILANQEPMDVTTLCGHVGMGCQISMMSHHLTKMKDNGVLTSQKQGKQVFYSIANRNLLNIFNCLENGVDA
ncbi:MAG: transcriptional regulator [Crocinitomicaceae bacterium]|nr:transcriptional regulator [Crocinitomicaceae bacterium]